MLQNAPLPLDNFYIKYLNIKIVVDFCINRLIIPKPGIIPSSIPANLHPPGNFLIQKFIKSQQDDVTLLIIL